MSSRDLSPNSLQRGLWSTATTRLEQPSTKCRALSSASATARASPSMGAYLDSAACVNLDPTRVTFHPSWQQNISWDGHWQCFWNSQYPTPSLLQSVARHVGHSLSNMRTPSLILDVISSLDASNACWRSSVHMNWAEGFRRARNGAMTGAMEKANATWLTSPNQALMSVIPLRLRWRWTIVGHRRCISSCCSLLTPGCRTLLCRHLPTQCIPGGLSGTGTSPMVL